MSMSVSTMRKGPRPRYAILTTEMIDDMFTRRLATASLLTRSRDKKEAFMAFMILTTLQTIKEEIEEKLA